MDRKHQPSSTESQSVESTILFSAFRLEPDGSFFRGETLIHLPPRELGALRLLVANAGQIVTPSQIKQALWGDVHVTAESVPRCLSSLRARLEPDDCIQTVYKRGYRLVAEVQRQSVPTAGGIPRLAIVPFATESGVPEHLGPMIAEEAIARLTNAPRRLVAPLARDSVFALSSNGLTALEVGQTLKADLVVAGTLHGLLAHIRLRVEMIRTSDGVQMWVEDLLMERGKSGSLEAELVARLETRMQSLPVELSRKLGQHSAGGPEQVYRGPERRGQRPPVKQSLPGPAGELLSLAASAETFVDAQELQTRSEAYDAFVRGHHEWQTLERHRMQDGLQHLTRAIELDPSLVAARVDLVHLAVTQSMFGFMAPSVAAEIVHRTTASVPDIARNAPRMLPCLAWINFHFDRNIPASLWALSHSAHLPHDPGITRLRALIAMSRHRFADAIELMRSAIEFDPFSPWLNSRLAWALHLDGQYAESLNQIERCIRHFPSDEGTALYGSQLLAFHGETARAVALAEHLAHRFSSFDLATSVLANALACAGRRDEALGMLERLHWLGRERFVLGSFNAPAFVALGAPEAALAELQASDNVRCPWFFQILADPRLKPLHDLPGFQELQAILPRMEAAVTAEFGDADGSASNF